MDYEDIVVVVRRHAHPSATRVHLHPDSFHELFQRAPDGSMVTLSLDEEVSFPHVAPVDMKYLRIQVYRDARLLRNQIGVD